MGYWSVASLLNLNYIYELCLSLCKPVLTMRCISIGLCVFIEHHHREKRQTHDHKKNTCPLLLVADYRFFKHMGRGQESVTLNYLV